MQIFKIFSFLYLAAGTCLAGAKSTNTSPTAVSVECLLHASNQFQIPGGILAAILSKEAGKPGQEKRNTDGSIDYGPAQINSKKLLDLSKYGISKWHVTNDPCYATYVAAFIVADHWSRTNDLWQAVGNYHSKTPRLNLTYRQDIAKEAIKWDKWLNDWFKARQPKVG